MKSAAVEINGDNTAPSSDQKKEETKNPPVKNYWRILSFGTRLEHVLLIVAVASATASGVALPLMNIVFGRLVGNFNNYFIPGKNVTESQFKHSVAQNALYFVYLFIGKFILSYIGIFCFRTAGLRISASLRLSYLTALFAQPIKKLDEVSVGTVTNTITTAANTIQMSVSDRLSLLFQSLALSIAALAIAFTYSWALTLVTCSTMLFLLVYYALTSPSVIKEVRRVDKLDEKHATVAAETVGSIRTVFALGAEGKMIERYTKWVDEAHKCGIKIGKWIAVQLFPMYFAIYCSYALAFWFGLKLYREGHIDNVGTVIVVFFSILLVVTVLSNIVHPLMNVQKAISAAVPFFEMMDSDQVQTSGLTEPDVSARYDIELKNITFAYPTRPGVEVLKDFNVTFKKGKTTALVGPSGSGKSTIVALLERWYELGIPKPQEKDSGTQELSEKSRPEAKNSDKVTANDLGSITTSGHNINEFDLRWWRTQIGLVQQEPFLFNDTIENNVAYGLIGTIWENADHEKKFDLITAACKEAFADDFITKLPERYSSMVGEGGIKLSGGQRQRIAIARSIVRQPAILILDEATSAIDVRGEKIVQAALDRASQDRTTIVIAHRLSTICRADHIVVLRNGSKIEEGDHAELMSIDDGLYHSLVRAQMIEEEQTDLLEQSATDIDLPIESVSSRVSKLDEDIPPLDRSGMENPAIADIEKAIPPTTYKTKGVFGTVGVLLYEQRSVWPFCLLVLFAAMACGAAYALQSWFFAHLVTAFQYTGQKLTDAANFWALMFFILAIAVATAYGNLAFNSVVVSTRLGTYCRKHYFRSTVKMPIVYFDRHENASGSVVQRLSGDPKQVIELLGLNSAFPLVSVFNVIGSVIISFYFGWKLTLVTLFAVMPIIIGASFFRVRYEVQFEKLNAEVFATSSRFAAEAVSAFRTVSSLSMEEVVIKNYEKLLSDQVKASTRKASYAMLVYAFTDSIELCGMALTFWYGGQLLATREYQPIQFFVIFAATIQSAQAAGQYLSISTNLAYATASANRILEMRHRVADSGHLSTGDGQADSKRGAKIEFQDISFRYPGVNSPLFTHLDITIDAGQFVAFVGPSGCGKTTTISLLERFYDPFAGTIRFDGEDITAQNPTTYRQKIALVSQEPRLFAGTIRQNLVLGVDETAVTDDQIEQACRNAEIHEFIISLPDGYGTELGQNTSTALSGGQKQRLCLARALLRQPKLLLLDEATSSLDSQSEKLVQGAIERLASQRSMTVIAVAHRLATIQKADTIFVFGERDTEGKRGSMIVERGSHNELLSERGVYYSMCQAQALDK